MRHSGVARSHEQASWCRGLPAGGESHQTSRTVSAATTAPAIDALETQALTASFWFDSGRGHESSSATVRFSGRRIGVIGPPGRGDAFVQEETIEGIVPLSGPVSITTRVYGINPGEWKVNAELVAPRPQRREQRRHQQGVRRGGQAIYPAAWSWRRWALSTGTAQRIKTTLPPLAGFAGMPAVIPGSWVGLVTLGGLIGLASQVSLMAYGHVDVHRGLTASALALLTGLLGAKLWYLALNHWKWRGSTRDGLCIQGFLLGAVVGGAAALATLHLPIGTFLDATSPGLFLGLAIGRLGCFLTGCCAGRATASRWSVWSSDRRVGARRIPTQLLESVIAAALALTGWLLYMHLQIAIPGSLFVGSFAAYTLCRQFLLRLRVEPRKSSIGGPLTAEMAALVLFADVAWWISAAH